MFNVLQKSACTACRVQPLSAELILWITRHSSIAVKWGFRAHLDPTLAEREGSRPQDPHRIDATVID